jgi:uncharacterized protein YdhG (YjbR/CyaY superfamily)
MRKPKRTAEVRTAKRKNTSTTKTKPKIQTVAEYVASVPAPARAAFSKLRTAVRSAVPRGAKEIISYRIPAFRQGRVLVWFAAFSDHCSLFPTSSVIERFKDELKPFSTSKGTVQFPLDKPLPIALIKRMVKARLAELVEKQ